MFCKVEFHRVHPRCVHKLLIHSFASVYVMVPVKSAPLSFSNATEITSVKLLSKWDVLRKIGLPGNIFVVVLKIVQNKGAFMNEVTLVVTTFATLCMKI